MNIVFKSLYYAQTKYCHGKYTVMKNVTKGQITNGISTQSFSETVKPSIFVRTLTESVSETVKPFLKRMRLTISCV